MDRRTYFINLAMLNVEQLQKDPTSYLERNVRSKN